MYFPLEIVETFLKPVYSQNDKSVFEAIQRVGEMNGENIAVDEESFIRYVLSPDFLTRKNKAYECVDNLAVTFAAELPMMQSESRTEYIKGVAGLKLLKTDLKDEMLSGLILEKWTKNKQVYKTDNTFTEALISTTKLSFALDDFKRLPCNTFWIDTSDCPLLSPVVGILVHVKVDGELAHLVSYQFTKEMLMFSGYTIFHYGKAEDEKLDLPKGMSFSSDNKSIMIDINSFGFHFDNGLEYSQSFILKTDNGDIPLENKDNRKAVNLFTIQFLQYMISSNKDVVENKVTKGTYRKPKENSVPKNKFSEIQQYDVGYVFGEIFRQKIKTVFVKESKIDEDICTEEGLVKKEKITRRPHFVSAHWTHVWTGKGREVNEVRWIEPYFTGIGKNESIPYATIHKVK